MMNQIVPEKTILVTGGAGFIGSNFIQHWLEKYPRHRVINVDKLTYASDAVYMASLSNLYSETSYCMVQGDLCDAALVSSLFDRFHITNVIHFAAESHVDNSINNPTLFAESNVQGTAILLEAARQAWRVDQDSSKNADPSLHRFHHISTDEVYGSLGPTGYFSEESPYAPNSPYSASKAGADMLVRAYHHTYGMNTVITNCSNNYGPRQHDEKLIPTIIRNALQGLAIPIYGDGRNVRDWLYVLDHCKAVDQVFHRGITGETYCIGGNQEMENIAIANLICLLLDELNPLSVGSYSQQITYVTDRPGHDRRYAINASKIQKNLGWLPEENFESGLRKTVQWYLNRLKDKAR